MNMLFFRQSKRQGKQGYLFFFIIIIITVFLYRDYIFGESMYIFSDVAGDSIGQTFPYYMNLAYEVNDYGRVLPWNWSTFLGQSQTTYFDIFQGIIYFFGPENVGYLMGIMQVLKVIIAGMLFWIYARIRGFSWITSMITSLGYAFCGHMIARGAWMNYPTEVICAALLLIGLECVLQKRKYGICILPISLAFLIFSCTIYTAFLYIFICIGYILFRNIELMNCQNFKQFFINIKNAFLLMIIGIGIAAIKLIPSLLEVINSRRVNVNISRISQQENASSFFDLETIITSFLRLFSNDLAGDALAYKGAQNYLEGPAFYCGILLVCAIPFAFQKKSTGKNILYIVTLFLCIIYSAITPIRVLANALDSQTFKLSSFWIIVACIYIGGNGLENLIAGKYNRFIGICWGIILIKALAILYYSNYHNMIDDKNLKTVLVFTGIYPIIFFVQYNKPLRSIHNAQFLLLLTFFIEIVVLSNPAINHRSVLSKKQYNEYLNTEISKIAADLHTSKEDVFRIDYLNYSYHRLNDSWINNIWGTRSYLGGLSFSKGIQEFISCTGNSYMDDLGYSRKVYGFTGNNEVNTFLGVKYLLYDKNTKYRYVPYGYKEIFRKDWEESDVYVYENQYYLPLFFTYDHTIQKDKFLALNKENRRKELLSAMVIGEGEYSLNVDEVIYDQEKLESIIYFSKDDIALGPNAPYQIMFNNERTYDYYLLRFKVNCIAEEMIPMSVFITWGDAPQNGIEYYTATGNEDIILYFPYNETIDSIQISYSSSMKQEYINITDMQLSGIHNNYFDEYISNVEARKKSNIDIVNFGGDQVQLKANIDRNQEYLFASIPYTKNWHVYVDGREAKTIEANFGFTGILLNHGYHEIQFQYKKDIDWKYYAVSGVFFLIWVLYMVICSLKGVIGKQKST